MENTMNNDLKIDQSLSLYIYGVSPEYANEGYIYDFFKNLNIGEVNSVYFREARNIELRVTGYDTIIYMKQWYSNCMVESLQEKITDPLVDARIVYDDPNFWILYKNNIVLYSEIANLQKIVTEQTKQLYTICSQMSEFDLQIKSANIRMLLYKTNLEHLTNKLDTINRESSFHQSENVVVSNEIQQLYTNNSCCGAASDAWVPSYPSVNTNS